MNLTRSSLKLFVVNMSNSAISFLGIMYFARELGPVPLGVFFLFQALLGLLVIPADLGLRGAVEKRISEGKSEGEFLSSAITLKGGLLLIIVMAILLFQVSVNDYLGADLAILLALALLLQEASRLSVFTLRGELRVGETATLEAARQLTWVGVSIILLSVGLGPRALVFGLLSGMTVMLVWGWRKISTPLTRPTFKQASSLFDYGKYNFISAVGGYFYKWMDVALLGLLLTQTDVGAYEVAWRVTLIPVLLSTAIAKSIFPQLSKWDADGTKQKIEKTVRNALTPSLILVIPSFFGVLVFAREILRFMFGPEYTIAWLVLIVLMGEKLFQAPHKILGRGLKAIDKPELTAYATVVSLGINLLLNVVLILKIGLIGAAVATAASFALNTALHAYFLSRYVSIQVSSVEIGWLVVSSTLMAGALYILKSHLVVDGLLNLLLLIGLGVVIYSASLMLYKPLRKKTMNQARNVKSGI